MRLIDKLKKKLKRLIWWKENRHKVVLGAMLPCAFVHLILSPFFPIVGIIALSTYLLIGVTAGVEIIWTEESLPRRIDDLKEHIDILQGVNQESLVKVEEELEEAKAQKPTTEYGKEQKKMLIRELIERNNIIKQALREQNFSDEDTLTL